MEGVFFCFAKFKLQVCPKWATIDGFFVFCQVEVSETSNPAPMKHLPYSLFWPFLWFLPALLHAQEPKITDFRLDGDARPDGGNCITLTPDYQWASGSIWYKKAISLNAPFEMKLKVMLGCQDGDGADGMVFVFQPYAKRTGYRGEGMGFAGLRPALGIEIDTWLNDHLGDPPQDHVAILRDGSVAHMHNLAGPRRIPNIEDCRKHELRIRWSAQTNTLTIYLDGSSILSYREDIVQQIFRGEDEVYWGVTSATGNYNNRQAVCFEELKFELVEERLPLELEGPKKADLMKGEFIALERLRFETGGAKLTPASQRELDALARIMRQNPKLALDIIGHTDNVGSARTNLSLSEIRSQAVARYLKSKGISPERINARGLGERFPRNTNATKEGRLKNRRVEFRLTEPIA